MTKNNKVLSKLEMKDGIKLSIIIPCYNEEKVLPLTLEKLKTLYNEWSSRYDCESIEFLFVDDGSQDRTAKLMAEATHKYLQFNPSF